MTKSDKAVMQLALQTMGYYGLNHNGFEVIDLKESDVLRMFDADEITAQPVCLLEDAMDIIASLRAAIAQPEQPTNSGELHFPLMCKAFRTTVSQGLDKRYEMVFAFPDLTALHAADTEWLNFREAAIAQPVKPEYANAYYEICEILGLSAMSVSPEIAHKTVVIPLLKSIFSRLPARCDQTRFCEKHPNCSPACTAIAQSEQPAPVRQPLTHTEITSLAYDCNALPEVVTDKTLIDFARAIEAAITQPKAKP